MSINEDLILWKLMSRRQILFWW